MHMHPTEMAPFIQPFSQGTAYQKGFKNTLAKRPDMSEFRFLTMSRCMHKVLRGIHFCF